MQTEQIIEDAKVNYGFNLIIHFTAVFGILALLISIYMNYAPIYIAKARLTEGLFQVSTLRQDVSAYYFENGRWPASFVMNGESESYFPDLIKEIRFDGQGGFHVTYQDESDLLNAKTLSLVAAISTEKAFTNLLWICGYDSVPSGYQLTSQPQNTIAKVLVTFPCRQKTI